MFAQKLRLAKRDARGAQTADNASSVADCSGPSSPRSQHSEAVESEHASSKYLIITVVEARNLVAKDYDTHSSDPFVKITLGALSKKTRAIYRNCHPLWEQKLVFPIAGLDDGVPLQVELFDKDFNSKEFLGQVMMTLGKALDIAADEVQRGNYWLVLSKKRSSDVVGGELCLGFELTTMDQQQYSQLVSELDCQLSSDSLASTYSSKALHIQLKGLNGLAASGLFGGAGDKAEQQQLSLFIKYGRVMLEKQLPPPVPPVGAEDDPGVSCSEVYEVSVNEEVVIPMAPAVRATPLVARKKDELYDIKLYLKSHDTLIAKTQIPITSVPISSAAEQLAPACSDSPLSTRSATQEVVGQKGLAVSLDGVCLISSSVPSTPRGTTADFGPLTPNSSPMVGDMPASPMTRSKSDAAFGLSALNKRLGALGGWVGSSSNISNLGSVSSGSPSTTASLASTMAPRSESPFRCTAPKFAVEGSYDSVTAYSRGHPVHAPASLHGRKVQGLAEMHEGPVAPLNGLRKPLKAIFVPPREVNRSGWVPSKPHEDGEESLSPVGRSRSFTRIMESTVPMYCNLEVSMGLAVLEQKAVSASTETVAAVTELSEDSISDDEEEEESAQASPIQLGPPLEVLLQDATLQGVGVNRLYALTISSDSDFMKAHHAAHDVSEMSIGPWRAVPAGAGYQRVRNVSYVKKLNIPLPLAPEKCHVWEEHRLVTKEAGGWVVQITCKNDAPKGDCFEAHVQMCGVYVNSNTSRLRVSMQLNWIKNTWGKNMVQGGAETDAKRSYAALVKRLREQASSSPGIKLQAEVQPMDETSTVDTAPKSFWGRLLRRSNVELLLQGLLVLALLLVAGAVLSAGRSISAELRQVAAVMRACPAQPASGSPASALVERL